MGFNAQIISPQLREASNTRLHFLGIQWDDSPEMQWLLGRELAFRKRWPSEDDQNQERGIELAAMLACWRTRYDQACERADTTRSCDGCPFSKSDYPQVFPPFSAPEVSEPPYQAPTQSPHWDDVMSLSEMLAAAKFFILRKGAPHGDLVDVVLASEEKEGQLYYTIRALNHDAAGVTCVASGTIGAVGIAFDLTGQKAELTGSSARVLRYIWEVMHCHPNADTKLFTQS